MVNLLDENGTMIVTIPIGENPYLDKMLAIGCLKFSETYAMIKIGRNWWQVSFEEAIKYKGKNMKIVIIGILRKKTTKIKGRTHATNYFKLVRILMIMPSKNILIVDSDLPFALSVIRSLASIEYNLHLGFSYGSDVFNAFSKYCSKYCKGIIFYPDPSYAREDFLNFFEKLAGKYDFIIPLSEKTQLLISMIKEMLEEKRTLVPIPSYDTLKIAVNKVKMLEFCSRIGINIPKTLVLTDAPMIDDVVEKVGIPFIMKTSTEIDIPPGPQHRYFVFKKKPVQEHFLVAFKKLRKHGPVILQEWIEGTGIGASFIFSKYHKVIAYFGHRRILERFPDGGPSVIAESYLYPDALKNGAKLLKALNWQGVAMVEFRLKHDGKLYFMELNPRFWGTLPLAIASGVDFPRLLVEYYNSTQENNFLYSIQKKKYL